MHWHISPAIFPGTVRALEVLDGNFVQNGGHDNLDCLTAVRTVTIESNLYPREEKEVCQSHVGTIKKLEQRCQIVIRQELTGE